MQLVTIAEFDNPTKAHLAKMQLEMGEVEAFLIDLETNTMDWALGRAIGLIKLQVREADAEKATEIIAGLNGGEPDAETKKRSEKSAQRVLWAIGGVVVAIFAFAFTKMAPF